MKRVLADISIWVAHFRAANPTLQSLLITDRVLCHPLVLIETQRCYDAGCGAIDVALLASVLLTPNANLWTFDKSLAALAARVRLEIATRCYNFLVDRDEAGHLIGVCI